MSRKTSKHSKKNKKTQKHKLSIVMIGCSNKTKKTGNKCKKNKTIENKKCHHCGKKCYCGSKCKCKRPCPGKCCLNKRKKVLMGGNKALVGEPWGSNVSQWPGVNGVAGDRNYLDSSSKVISNDPSLQMSMNDAGYKTMNSKVGGYTYNKRASKTSKSHTIDSIKKGGGIFQEVSNLGRSLAFGAESAYNTMKGIPTPVNPLPYKDQLLQENKDQIKV